MQYPHHVIFAFNQFIMYIEHQQIEMARENWTGNLILILDEIFGTGLSTCKGSLRIQINGKITLFLRRGGGGVLRMNLSNYTSSIKFSWNNKNNNNSIEADRRDLLMSSVSLIDLFSFPLSVGICYFFFVCVFISLLRNQQTKSMESMAVWLFTFPIFTPFTLIYSRYHTSFSKWLTIEKRIIYDFIGPFVIYNLRKTVFLIFGK